MLAANKSRATACTEFSIKMPNHPRLIGPAAACVILVSKSAACRTCPAQDALPDRPSRRPDGSVRKRCAIDIFGGEIAKGDALAGADRAAQRAF